MSTPANKPDLPSWNDGLGKPIGRKDRTSESGNGDITVNACHVVQLVLESEELNERQMTDHSPELTPPVLARGFGLTTVADAMNYIAELRPEIWMDEDYQATRDALVTALDTRDRADIERASALLSRFLRAHEVG